MKTITQTVRRATSTLAAAAVATVLTTTSTKASLIFSEDFESPDVTPISGGLQNNGAIPANWVGANQGFGATRRGITDKAGGDFSAPDPNMQAFAFRYTNSGLTTAEGVIGALTLGETYTLTFDVVRDDGGSAGTPYIAELVAFPVGAARNDVRPSYTNLTVLASTNGNAPGDGSFGTVSFDFTPETGTHDGVLGFDVGIRFLGATTSATIDNVAVDVSGGAAVPEASEALVWLLGMAGFASVRRRRREGSPTD